MNAGGAETFLMKLYRAIDKSEYQFDFCINVKEKCFYEDEILAMGGRIFRIPSKSENMKEFRKQLYSVVKENGYKHVLRITSNTMGFLDLKIAKDAGAEVLAARSSNSSGGGSFKSRISHIIGKLLYSKYVNVKIAPSDLAAIYTFGKAAYDRGEVALLNNAVDTGLYKYDSEARREARAELGIPDDARVVGHVGRFMTQKNHTFLLDVFKALSEKDEKAILLLIGDGELRGEIEQKINALGLESRVILAGVRRDVPRLLSAMDAFVLPSFYEGMPNVVIEAQANGLSSVIADTITKEANITEMVNYISLSAGADEWADNLSAAMNAERRDTRQCFIDNGYDIESSVKKLVSIIFEGGKA